MKSAVIALFTLAAAAAVGVPAAGGDGAAGGVCEQMTVERLLRNPRFAKEWSEALRGGDSAAIDRMHEALSQLRALHGCDGDPAPGSATRHGQALPPGHPPVDGGGGSAPGGVLFEEPSTLDI